ncbi:MAG: protein translocase subunit SecD [Gammaproteobacteria bacterium]|nr:protein translocase subunit SecD [Gammaproteobacteria bacterium]MDH3449374.1 protein translocase subunit SecD [Gammaproteobacteria bacterium]
MVNRYAPWRYILLILIIAVGVVYATPNLYGEDPAVQITHRVNLVDEAELGNIRNLLETENIDYRSIELDGNNVLVRFPSEEAQLKAAAQIRDALHASDRRYSIALNLAPATPDWLTALNALPMYLGLDLRGGVHFLMEVDMESAIEKSMQRTADELRSFMREEKIRYRSVQTDKRKISVRFTSAAERDAARLLLEDEYRDFEFADSNDDLNWFIEISFNPTALEEERRAAIEQNISTLKNRVNELGVAEPVIQRQGEERVVVQLPGVQDTVRAKEILGATATLEFRLVHGSFAEWNAAQASGKAPIGTRLYTQSNGDPVLLKRSVIVTGDQIVGAASGIDQQSGSPDVTITMNANGADRMARVTRDNIGKPMAVVFIEDKFEFREENGVRQRIRTTESQVINVATIRDQLSKRFHITGLDSTREARDLALLLRAGALRAPMVIVEERTVGPSLGQENIDRGFLSVVVGFVLVLLFMSVYYKVFGLVANLALTLNLVLMVAILSIFQATLTLPGIAGIVLTVGMAVDANVLIFERIREEIRIGNTPQAAIYVGYEKAFGTIADANITTFIAAIVLFGFGTGPIQGFAVTLMIGIVSSMFTAIFGTRAVINLIYGRKQISRLAI